MSDIQYRVQTREDPLDIYNVIFITRSRKPNKGDYVTWAERLTVEWGTTIHAIYEDAGPDMFSVGVVPRFETEAYKAQRETLVAYNEYAYEIEGPLYDVSRRHDEMVRAMNDTASDFERVGESLRKHVNSVTTEPYLYLYKDDRWADHFYDSFIGRFIDNITQLRVEHNIKDVATVGAALDRALLRSRRILDVRLAAQAPEYACCDDAKENPLYITVPSEEDHWKAATIVCAHCRTELPSLPRYEIPAIPVAEEEEVVCPCLQT